MDSQLHSKRSGLKLQERYADAIPMQQEILKLAQQNGRVQDIANAWNMLSHLYQLNSQLTEAEEAARHALISYVEVTPQSSETLATYEMKLATILAAQCRFTEAVEFGELAIDHYSEFHKPPDEFLNSRKDDVALMIQYRDQVKD